MTATPRIYGDAGKAKAEKHNVFLASMDDEVIYGPELHRLGFAASVEDGLLSDYRVLVLAINERTVAREFQRHLGDPDVALDDLGRVIGCLNGLAKLDPASDRFKEDPAPMRRAILHGYGALRLPQMIPASVAMEMLLTGDFIDAERALQVGLVSRVVAAEQLLPTARALADRIARNGPLAVRMTKELARRGAETPLADGLRLYQEYNRVAHGSADALEGTRAFQEKRDPEFRGR